ncbi:MAG: response regulator transcription factor [bacterium]|nr:response regulator transcription factor [bacterium]
MRILLIEDERALADALEYILKKNKYQVDVAYDGIAGEDYALTNSYDVLIMDRMLPGKEGVEILKTVRENKIHTPAMFLTAKSGIDDRVEGLEAGADDYLVKPFANKELLARVKALLRRNARLLMDEELQAGTLRLNVNQGKCSWADHEVSLTRTEAQLLELFLRNLGQTLTKEQILDRIWGFDKSVMYGNVELYIFYLRKKINFLEAELQLKTVRGMGYTLLEVQHDK